MYEAGACHPKVFEGEPDFYGKQVQFFDQDQRYEQGINFYTKRFEHCLKEGDASAAARVMFDATPNYLEFPKRVFHIYNQAAAGDASSKLKVIYVLREPVERELVTYNMKANDYNLSVDKKNGWFADALENDGSLMTFERYSLAMLRMYIKDKAPYYRSGHYAMHLKEWAKFFERSQLLVLSYDELQISPSTVQRRIEQFIGKEYEAKLQAYDGIKPEDVPKRAVAVLEPLFRKSNDELYNFLLMNRGPKMEQTPFAPFQQRISPIKHEGLVLPNILMIGAQKAGTSAVS